MEPISILKSEFINNEFVKYQQGFEGQKILNDGTVVIGNRAGPMTRPLSFSVKNLCHEMSHLVEINDERMRMHGWGLKVPEVWVYDRMCVEPTTKQMTDRELRVCAYQSELLTFIGVRHSISDLVGALQYLSDTCYVPIEDGRLPYGNNYEVIKAQKIDIKVSQHKWRINEVKKYKKEFTIDRFISEWNRKINWLANNKYVVDKD